MSLLMLSTFLIFFYLDSNFLKLVHGRKLFQTTENSRIKRFIKSNTVHSSPRMTCNTINITIFVNSSVLTLSDS